MSYSFTLEVKRSNRRYNLYLTEQSLIVQIDCKINDKGYSDWSFIIMPAFFERVSQDATFKQLLDMLNTITEVRHTTFTKKLLELGFIDLHN